MSVMLFSFFSFIREQIASIDAEPFVMSVGESSGFPIHPSASELAEDLLVDPEVLKNETYEPGIYDEDGDYYPQYTDDPSALPDGFQPNAPAAPADETVPESSPAAELQTPDVVDKPSE